MKIAKNNIAVKMDIPGAIVRQRTDFGDATGLGKISGEPFTLSKLRIGFERPACNNGCERGRRERQRSRIFLLAWGT